MTAGGGSDCHICTGRSGVQMHGELVQTPGGTGPCVDALLLDLANAEARPDPLCMPQPTPSGLGWLLEVRAKGCHMCHHLCRRGLSVQCCSKRF